MYIVQDVTEFEQGVRCVSECDVSEEAKLGELTVVARVWLIGFTLLLGGLVSAANWCNSDPLENFWREHECVDN